MLEKIQILVLSFHYLWFLALFIIWSSSTRKAHRVSITKKECLLKYLLLVVTSYTDENERGPGRDGGGENPVWAGANCSFFRTEYVKKHADQNVEAYNMQLARKHKN